MRDPKDLANDAVMDGLKHLVRTHNELTSELLAYIAEVDKRKLYLAEGYCSISAFCIEALGFSEAAAFHRVTAARLARRFPIVLQLVAAGAIHLSGLKVLGPHLTEANHAELLAAAKGRTRRQIEALVARLTSAPMPEPGPTIRPIAGSGDPAPAADPDAADAVHAADAADKSPIAPERLRVQFAAPGSFGDKLERARALLRHQIPSGDIAVILERALDGLIAHTENKRFAATDSPREPKPGRTRRRTRHIPADLKRAVYERDAGRCTFVGTSGHRCNTESFIEYHHSTPFSMGGDATVDNIRILCAGHNRHQAELDYGPEVIASARRANRKTGAPSAASAAEIAAETTASGTITAESIAAGAIAIQALQGLRQLGFTAAQSKTALARAQQQLAPGASLENVLFQSMRAAR